MKRNLVRDLFDLIRFLPWWLGLLITAGTWYYLSHYLEPYSWTHPVDPSEHITGSLKNLLIKGAPLILFFMGAATGLSAFHAFRKKRLLEKQQNIQSLALLNWRDFEFLVSEAFRRRGIASRKMPPKVRTAELI